MSCCAEPTKLIPSHETPLLSTDEVDPFEPHRASRVSDRESEYHQRRKRIISPERVDPFAEDTGSSQKKDSKARTYKEIMMEAKIEKQEYELQRQIEKQEREAAEKKAQEDKEKDEPKEVRQRAGAER